MKRSRVPVTSNALKDARMECIKKELLALVEQGVCHVGRLNNNCWPRDNVHSVTIVMPRIHSETIGYVVSYERPLGRRCTTRNIRFDSSFGPSLHTEHIERHEIRCNGYELRIRCRDIDMNTYAADSLQKQMTRFILTHYELFDWTPFMCTLLNNSCIQQHNFDDCRCITRFICSD
jgi:hypothetical protein